MATTTQSTESTATPVAAEAPSTSSPAAVELHDMASTNNGTDQTDSTRLSQQQQPPPPSSDPQLPTVNPPPATETSPEISHQDSLPKIAEGLGPATDLPIAALAPTLSNTSSGPILSITLMLTTGARHPYKIDERYLRNRKVDATNAQGTFDPREISGYKLKELIWTDWRSEWEPRPTSPSSIRLIILGRLLEDKSALRDFPFKLDDVNVVHMTVKPADFLDDDDTGGKTGKGNPYRGHDGEDRDAGCRCVIL